MPVWPICQLLIASRVESVDSRVLATRWTGNLSSVSKDIIDHFSFSCTHEVKDLQVVLMWALNKIKIWHLCFTFSLSSISHSCHRISKWHQFTCSCPSCPFWRNDSLRGHQYALKGSPMFQLISADFSWNVFLIVHISAAASVFQTTIYLWWPTANKLPVATNWFFYLRPCA